MKWSLALVALFALAVLGVRAHNAGMASGYIDPVGRIDAQDEALYAHGAIRMAERGGWMTPMFMGRYGLFKPPLTAWLAGISAKAWGVSALSLRLPSLLAAALAACLAWLWLVRLRSPWAAAAGVLLLVSNRTWQVVAGMCLTDGLLAAAMVAAVFCLYWDARLERRPAFAGFAVATAAGILAKSMAGVLPVLVLLLYMALARREERPPIARATACLALAGALAAPWFAYNALAHSRWFWAEHVGLEILAYGTGTPPQTSGENPLWFYARRMALTDPFLCAAMVLALPGFVAILRRKRSGQELLLACWAGVVVAAPLVWHYRNISYLLPAIPAFAILAAGYAPRPGRVGIAALALVFGLKVASPAQPWGLSFAHQAVATAPALDEYCRMRRASELIVVDPQDAFYATLLPLARLRYSYLAAEVPPGRYHLDFRSMGVMVTAGEFTELAKHEAHFAAHLREWGLDSREPLATVILARDAAEVARMIEACPESDFLAPARFADVAETAARRTHRAVWTPAGVLLLSIRAGALAPALRPCRL